MNFNTYPDSWYLGWQLINDYHFSNTFIDFLLKNKFAKKNNFKKNILRKKESKEMMGTVSTVRPNTRVSRTKNQFGWVKIFEPELFFLANLWRQNEIIFCVCFCIKYVSYVAYSQHFNFRLMKFTIDSTESLNLAEKRICWACKYYHKNYNFFFI